MAFLFYAEAVWLDWLATGKANDPAAGETIRIKVKRVAKFRVAKAAKDAILGTN